MVLKQEWEKTESQHALPPYLPEKIVQQAYPGQRLVFVEKIAGGCANLNLKIQLDHAPEPLLLRLYIRDARAAAKEQALAALLKPSLPIPCTYVRGACEGFYFAITEYMPGITLREVLLSKGPEIWDGLMEEAGVYLTQIAAHPGPISEESLPGYLAYAQTLLQHPVVLSCLSGEMVAKLDAHLERYGHLFPPASERQLVHADFDPSNMLVDWVQGKWKITAILDWEFAFAGSSLCDVATMLRYAHQLPPQFEAAFLKGLQRGGMQLPLDWRITVHLLNILSLLDCLAHANPSHRPRQCADIVALLGYIVEALDTA